VVWPQRRKPRARLLELFDAPSRRQRRGAHAPDRRDFEPCCPVLRRYFGEARPVATTIEAALIDGACEDQDRSVGVTQGDARAR